MILSNSAIFAALDDKRLIIEPEPTPRDPAGAMECPFSTTAVDLRLGDEVSWFNDGLAVNIDPGTYICQLIIEEVLGVPLRNDSQFQGQTRPTGS
jgi:deoxycytidine triphosphate deaminase